MSDRMHRALAWLIAAVMVTAVAAAPTVAQTTDPSAERVFEVAGVNADTVDGRHAIWATRSTSKRAKKLVATNKRGYLPENIVKPLWGLIQDKPHGFADGVDNVGVKEVRRVSGDDGQQDIGANTSAWLTVRCPRASDIPMQLLWGANGGHQNLIRQNVGWFNGLPGFQIQVQNTHITAGGSFWAYALCLRVS